MYRAWIIGCGVQYTVYSIQLFYCVWPTVAAWFGVLRCTLYVVQVWCLVHGAWCSVRATVRLWCGVVQYGLARFMMYAIVYYIVLFMVVQDTPIVYCSISYDTLHFVTWEPSMVHYTTVYGVVCFCCMVIILSYCLRYLYYRSTALCAMVWLYRTICATVLCLGSTPMTLYYVLRNLVFSTTNRRIVGDSM